jgi:hypothetical protein
MPKLQHARIVTKTFTPRPLPVAASEQAMGMFGPPIELSPPMTTALHAKHDIDVPLSASRPPPPELESGVFLSPDLAPNTDVSLIVYLWHNVQPGTLSWTVPTVRAAVSAAYAMKNAVKWAIVRGEESDIDAARRAGRVMIENC